MNSSWVFKMDGFSAVSDRGSRRGSGVGMVFISPRLGLLFGLRWAQCMKAIYSLLELRPSGRGSLGVIPGDFPRGRTDQAGWGGVRERTWDRVMDWSGRADGERVGHGTYMAPLPEAVLRPLNALQAARTKASSPKITLFHMAAETWEKSRKKGAGSNQRPRAKASQPTTS